MCPWGTIVQPRVVLDVLRRREIGAALRQPAVVARVLEQRVVEVNQRRASLDARVADLHRSVKLLAETNNSGFPRRIVGTGVPDESVDRGFVIIVAVGDAPDRLKEDPDASDVFPYVLTVDGRDSVCGGRRWRGKEVRAEATPPTTRST